MTKSKIAIYSLAALFIGAAISYGAFWYQNRGLVTSVDPGISQEEKQRLEAELADVDRRIAELKSDADSALRYGPYSERAEILQKLGRYNDALKTLEKIADENTDNPVVWDKIANLHVLRQDYVEAAVASNRAVGIDPENIGYWKRYIELKQKAGASKEEMESIFREAFFKTDQNTDIMLAYSEYHESINNYVIALNFMKFAADKEPDNEKYKREIERLEALVAEQNPS